MKAFLEAVLEHPWVTLYVAILLRFIFSGFSTVVNYFNNKNK